MFSRIVSKPFKNAWVALRQLLGPAVTKSNRIEYSGLVLPDVVVL